MSTQINDGNKLDIKPTQMFNFFLQLGNKQHLYSEGETSDGRNFLKCNPSVFLSFSFSWTQKLSSFLPSCSFSSPIISTQDLVFRGHSSPQKLLLSFFSLFLSTPAYLSADGHRRWDQFWDQSLIKYRQGPQKAALWSGDEKLSKCPSLSQKSNLLKFSLHIAEPQSAHNSKITPFIM